MNGSKRDRRGKALPRSCSRSRLSMCFVGGRLRTFCVRYWPEIFWMQCIGRHRCLQLVSMDTRCTF